MKPPGEHTQRTPRLIGAKMWDTVVIIGVGLIGGSIGMTLRRRGLAREIVGIGRRESTLQTALERNAITRATTDLASGVADAEVIVVCTPVQRIVEHVRQTSRACPPGALITDAGSTKGSICRTLAAGWQGGGVFVGGHPMAGSEKTGPEFAQDDLFEERLTVLTPTAETAEADVVRAEQFWRSLGSHVIRTTPEAHDEAVAAASHVPHVVAAALSAATPPEVLEFAATGWCATTRVAGGDAELWRQILVENRAHVLQSLDNFAKVLAQFRTALADDDDAELLRLLETGKERRDSVGS
jgi:prephenate dehydrogenase